MLTTFIASRLICNVVVAWYLGVISSVTTSTRAATASVTPAISQRRVVMACQYSSRVTSACLALR